MHGPMLIASTTSHFLDLCCEDYGVVREMRKKLEYILIEDGESFDVGVLSFFAEHIPDVKIR